MSNERGGQARGCPNIPSTELLKFCLPTTVRRGLAQLMEPGACGSGFLHYRRCILRRHLAILHFGNAFWSSFTPASVIPV
jgi:hypothetical protein